MGERLWHDDIRRPPEDEQWDHWARTNGMARWVLLNRQITEISLDHDLGLHDFDPDEQDADIRRSARKYRCYHCRNVQLESGLNLPPLKCSKCGSAGDGHWSLIEEEDGFQLALWMVENDLVPVRVTIHSWNPVGAQRMAEVLRGKCLHIKVEPFDLESRKT